MYNKDNFSDLAWRLFVSSGDINYYILHKKTKSKEDIKKEKRWYGS